MLAAIGPFMISPPHLTYECEQDRPQHRGQRPPLVSNNDETSATALNNAGLQNKQYVSSGVASCLVRNNVEVTTDIKETCSRHCACLSNLEQFTGFWDIKNEKQGFQCAVESLALMIAQSRLRRISNDREWIENLKV